MLFCHAWLKGNGSEPERSYSLSESVVVSDIQDH